MPEQRKIVTVLFCDLVGSTELSGVLEPETLRAVVLDYFAAMRRTIEAHGGTVEKFIGDAVMAVFGVPVVREDDAYRGAAAALDMIAALERLNTELERSVGSTLAVRIGVNSGEAVTSDDLTGQTMVSGEMVNVAARLEQRAEAGRILIGPTTRALLGGAALVDPVGALDLKGKRAPVDAFRLRGLVRGGARRGCFDTPFVGRGPELALLDEAWRRARDGGAVLVELSADAGLGKTRLLHEWLAAPPGADALTGTGRCHPYRDRPGLTPLADAVRAVLDEAARRPETSHTLDGPAYRVLRGGLLADGTPSPSAEETYAALARVLGGLAAAVPVVLVLDDMHWARPPLFEAVDRLTEALAGAPVLLVCSGRPQEQDRSRPTAAHVLRLGPLPDDDVARLVAQLVDTMPHGPTALDETAARAEGNPLYLEQLVAMLRDGADPRELPATVAAVLTARIDALDQAERTVLEVGAVIGRRFGPASVRGLTKNQDTDAYGGPGLLTALSGGTSDVDDVSDVDAALDGLERRGLIEPASEPAGEFQFSAGLLHEVTYRSISKRRRSGWHERLAHIRGTEHAVRAHHFEQAYELRRELGRRDAHTEELRGRAVESLAEAGRHALARADLAWSADLHQRALRYCAEDDPGWAGTALRLGEAWLALGRAEEGRDLLDRVLAVSSAAGDRLAEAHARLQLGVLDTAAGAGSGGAADAARAGLPVFRAAGDRLGLARAHIRLAQEHQARGRHRAAEVLLAEALADAVAAGMIPERAMALGALGVSLWHGPTPAGAAERRIRELMIAHQPGHAVVAVTLNYPLANLLALQGRFDEARACAAVADLHAADLGYQEAACFGPLFAAGVESLAGALEPAEALLRRAVRESRRLGGGALLAAASRDLARVLLARGAPPQQAVLGPDPDGPADAADQLGVRALIHAAHGETAPALAAARRAVRQAELTDSPIARATARLDLARVLAAAGSAPQARRAAEQAARWFADKGHAVGLRTAADLASGAMPDRAAAYSAHLTPDAASDAAAAGSAHLTPDATLDPAEAGSADLAPDAMSDRAEAGSADLASDATAGRATADFADLPSDAESDAAVPDSGDLASGAAAGSAYLTPDAASDPAAADSGGDR